MNDIIVYLRTVDINVLLLYYYHYSVVNGAEDNNSSSSNSSYSTCLPPATLSEEIEEALGQHIDEIRINVSKKHNVNPRWEQTLISHYASSGGRLPLNVWIHSH